MKRLLLISNSTHNGESFLSYTRQYIKQFLGESQLNIVFIPYAAVDISWLEYTNMVHSAFSDLGHTIKSAEDGNTPASAINSADAIIIGGGNTFNLLYHLQEKRLMDVISSKVKSGTPYIGWSAGANVACPGIFTTNDMPVIQPDSFKALNLVPFQINPHYTDGTIPNYNGESREERIREFLQLHQEKVVVGLREGSMLLIEDKNIEILGNKTVKLFRYNLPTMEYDANSTMDFILKEGN
jgi:dipeptidase E